MPHRIAYLADTSWLKVRRVVVERETDACYWVGGKRRSKSGWRGKFCGSFQEAKDVLVSAAQKELDSARLRLKQAQGALGQVSGLKEKDVA